MPSAIDLPLLPLMLAGVPRLVSEALREVGVPVATLPRVPLIANGCGRFVLFDSRSTTSLTRANRAVEQGLQTIDLAAVLTCLDDAAHASPIGPQAVLAKCMEHLKHEIEARGGVWLRVADYPFPYHSATSVAIGYPTEVVAADVLRNLPRNLLSHWSHYISTRSRPEQLSCWREMPGADIGWLVEPDDLESSRRKTLTHWTTRAARFRDASVAVRGLMLTTAGLRLPATRDLVPFGLGYSGHPDCLPACRMENGSRESTVDWVQLGTITLRDAITAALRDFTFESSSRSAKVVDDRLDSDHVLAPDDGELFESLSDTTRSESLHEWVRAHYLAGEPLFLVATADTPSLGTALRQVHAAATRCPLMWQPSIGEFVRWWRLRQQLALQVWRRDGVYEIQVQGPAADHAPWAIEIWKGGHVATLPLKQSEIRVAEEGLVFMRAETKSCCGISLAPNHPLAPRAKLSFPKSSCQDDSNSSHFSQGKDS
ncbi:MAG: hypothetical protein HZA46_21910 [Planctomycetales bacterium]|nr:hypothetical protein [Planctomycetales bacterium]